MVVLSVTPSRGMVDEEVSINVTHMLPWQPVTLYAFLLSEGGVKWESWGHYTSDEDGSICVNRHKSYGGTYSGLEPMGLFWSMKTAVQEKKGHRLRHVDVTKPRVITVQCFLGVIHRNFNDLTPVNECVVERWYIKPGVRRIPITEGTRVTATLFVPPGPGLFPLVINIGGGAGGLLEYMSSLIASHGFASATIAYINHPDLPFEGLGVDYIQEACDYICRMPNIDVDNIGVISLSQGVSLALEFASQTQNKLKCVILTNGGYLQSLPTTQIITNALLNPEYDSSDIQDKDGNHMLKPLSDVDKLRSELGEQCFVKVRNIRCPCLFFISGDDPSYSNEQHFQEIYKELSKVGKENLVQVMRYPMAGHLIEPPYSPHCRVSYVSLPEWARRPKDVYLAYGGTPKPHAMAEQHAWNSTFRFFNKYLRPKVSGKIHVAGHL